MRPVWGGRVTSRSRSPPNRFSPRATLPKAPRPYAVTGGGIQYGRSVPTDLAPAESTRIMSGPVRVARQIEVSHVSDCRQPRGRRPIRFAAEAAGAGSTYIVRYRNTRLLPYAIGRNASGMSASGCQSSRVAPRLRANPRASIAVPQEERCPLGLAKLEEIDPQRTTPYSWIRSLQDRVLVARLVANVDVRARSLQIP
jgi:hypothetical protein